jgi:hypothetical protein
MPSKKFFFNDGRVLAQLFTQDRFLSYEESKWFGDDDYPGCKAMEAFQADITTNLVEWGFDDDKVVFYRTKKYWYMFAVEAIDSKGPEVVMMHRFENGTTRKWSTWANLHSCSVGREFLMNPKQKAKKIPLYHTN